MSDHEKGMEKRRAILGDAHVDRAEANKTTFDTDFQRFITDTAWGKLWSRKQFSDRERSIVTLSLLAALGNFEELALHTRATANTGASREDILEAMMHVAVYAGVPRANHAIKIIKQTFAEMEGHNE